MAAPRILALLPLFAVSAAPLPPRTDNARIATARASVRIMRPLRLESDGTATRSDAHRVQRHLRACPASDTSATALCTMLISEVE